MVSERAKARAHAAGTIILAAIVLWVAFFSPSCRLTFGWAADVERRLEHLEWGRPGR